LPPDQLRSQGPEQVVQLGRAGGIRRFGHRQPCRGVNRKGRAAARLIPARPRAGGILLVAGPIGGLHQSLKQGVLLQAGGSRRGKRRGRGDGPSLNWQARVYLFDTNVISELRKPEQPR
jgi:hypothetical protein